MADEAVRHIADVNELFRNAVPPMSDDVSVTLDGRRLDSLGKFSGSSSSWPEAEQAIAELRGRLGNEWDPYLRKLSPVPQLAAIGPERRVVPLSEAS